MRIALIGGAGFIGLAAAGAIEAAGDEAVVLDSRRRLDRVAAELVGLRAATVAIEAAAVPAPALAGFDAAVLLSWASVPATSMASAPDDARDTVVPALRTAAAAAAAGVGRLVFISSGGAVYGLARHTPIDEAHPTDPVSAYGAGKLAVEKYLPLLSSSMSCVSLRLSNPFGPYQLHGVPVGVIASILRAMAQGRPVVIYGDGSVVRDFMSIDDAATAIALAADPDRVPAGVFNVGSGEGRSLNQVLAEIAEATGVEPAIERRPARAFDAPQVVLSAARFTAACGWLPQTDFRQALAATWTVARRRFGGQA